MKIKVVVLKTGVRGRPPICPWMIDAPEAPSLK
jgi:hypothetical protein